MVTCGEMRCVAAAVEMRAWNELEAVTGEEEEDVVCVAVWAWLLVVGVAVREAWWSELPGEEESSRCWCPGTRGEKGLMTDVCCARENQMICNFNILAHWMD